TGYVLSGYADRQKWFSRGLAIMLAGYALHLTEVFFLWKTFDSYPFKQYDFGTYPMGLGVAMMALANRPFIGRSWMSRFGRLTLGVYLIHPIFVNNLK